MSTNEIEKTPSNTVIVKNHEPVLRSVSYVLSRLDNTDTLTIRSKGNGIPNAVAVANIIRDMNNGITIQKIALDTDAAPGIGRMISTVEIILERI